MPFGLSGGGADDNKSQPKFKIVEKSQPKFKIVGKNKKKTRKIKNTKEIVISLVFLGFRRVFVAVLVVLDLLLFWCLLRAAFRGEVVVSSGSWESSQRG